VRRAIGVVAVVVVAMAVGRLLTDHVSDESLNRPFVRHGMVGETVPLRYADARVTGVRVATRIDGADLVVAAGRFLIVDVVTRAKGEPRTYLGLELWDRNGRRYAPSTRGSACSLNFRGVTGVPLYGMACFDVPKSALAGARFRLSLGGYGVNGSGERRDDLADIDLGISSAEAGRLWAQNLTYRSYLASTEPGDRKPFTPEKPSWWEDLK
jgi:hypothetical protein